MILIILPVLITGLGICCYLIIKEEMEGGKTTFYILGGVLLLITALFLSIALLTIVNSTLAFKPETKFAVSSVREYSIAKDVIKPTLAKLYNKKIL
jgi:hypothetical protein